MTNLKAKYFIFKKTFSKIPKVPLPLKNWLPEQNMASIPGYRNRIWLSNIGTGTECVSQILVPEQNIALKTWLPEQNMAIKYR